MISDSLLHIGFVLCKLLLSLHFDRVLYFQLELFQYTGDDLQRWIDREMRHVLRIFQKSMKGKVDSSDTRESREEF